MFYGIPFIPFNHHQPLEHLESLASKVNRVQRWFDLFRSYTYKLEYNTGRTDRNAGLMSRLPLPETPAGSKPKLRPKSVFHRGKWCVVCTFS